MTELRILRRVLGSGLLALALGASAAAAQNADLNAAERRAVAASGLPANAVVSVKNDFVVAVRERGKTSAGIIEGVTLQGEVVSNEAERAMGYRSMKSVVNVDCVRRRDLVTHMSVYPRSGAKGEAIQRQVPGGWAQPSPDAYLSDVIASVCAGVSVQTAQIARSAPSKPGPVVEQPDAPFRRETHQSSAKMALSVATPPPKPEPLPEPTPYGSELMVTAVGVRPAPQPPPPAPAEPPPRFLAMLRPAIAPPPVAAAPVSPTPRPAPHVEAPPVAKAAAPKVPGKVKVQVAAASSAAQAQDALAKLGHLPAPLSKSVQTATVEGKVFHRALVAGFQSRTEASAFCARLEGRGGACFIR